tara:strand:- start:10466 stop:11104 length:639 start_codon:yes stop_codon:yes gene_type:complete
MKNLTASIAISSILLLFGCAADGHTYSKDGMCLSCVNNPITGAPLNYDPAVDSQYGRSQIAASQQQPTHAAGSMEFQVDYDVEHVYYVVQREFSFPDVQQNDRYADAHRNPIDPEMVNERNRLFDRPGQFRYAQAFRQHGDLYLVIGVKIERIDSRSSKIVVSYLSDDPAQNVWNLGRSLRERIRSALEYYGCDRNIQRRYDNQYRYRTDPC